MKINLIFTILSFCSIISSQNLDENNSPPIMKVQEFRQILIKDAISNSGDFRRSYKSSSLCGGEIRRRKPHPVFFESQRLFKQVDNISSQKEWSELNTKILLRIEDLKKKEEFEIICNDLQVMILETLDKLYSEDYNHYLDASTQIDLLLELVALENVDFDIMADHFVRIRDIANTDQNGLIYNYLMNQCKKVISDFERTSMNDQKLIKNAKDPGSQFDALWQLSGKYNGYMSAKYAQQTMLEAQGN